MSEKTKTSAETWNDFIQLPDLRLRIKLAGLQVAAQEQAAEIAQKDQLIANLDVEQSQMKQRHDKKTQLKAGGFRCRNHPVCETKVAACISISK